MAFISTPGCSPISKPLFQTSFISSRRDRNILHISTAPKRRSNAQFSITIHASAAQSISNSKSKQKFSPFDVMTLALPERKALILGIIASLASSTILLLTPIAFGRVVDIISAFQHTGTQLGLKALRVNASRLFFLYILGSICRFAEVTQMRIAAEKIVASLRSRVFSKIIRSDVATLDATSTGDLMSRLSSDTHALQRVVVDHFVQLTQGALETLAGCIILLLLSRTLSLVVMITIPLSIIAGIFYGNRTAKLSKDVSTGLAKASQVANEQLAGIRIVKSFAQEAFAEKRYDIQVRNVLNLGKTAAHAEGLLQSWNRLIFTCNTCILFVLGGYLVAGGHLTVGTLMAFVIYTSNLMNACGKLSAGIGEIIRASGAVNRIMNILDTKTNIEGTRKRISPKFADIGYGIDYSTIRGKIEFIDVSFKYPNNERTILKNISFNVPAGGSIAFVGGSGAGKSTTLSLLSRFYDPTSGQIYLDDIPLKDYDLMDLRQNLVGIVSQEPYIISGTIADNIAFGRNSATRQDIEDAAEAAGVTQFACRMSQGLDTQITTLSGGEKQRLMIARCLAKKPLIMVLDEPTSALDRSSEALVNETIEKLIQDTERTLILISHRLTTVRHCDRIMVFQNGEITEHGSHEELVEKKGAYTKLLNAVR